MKRIALLVLASAALILLLSCGKAEPKTDVGEISVTEPVAESTGEVTSEPAVTDGDEGGTASLTTASETAGAETTAGHTHSYGVIADLEPTCAENGSVKYACACGATYTETVAKTAHTFADATCTSPKTCKICGATDGSALGHNMKNGACARCGYCNIDLGMSEEELKNAYGAPTETFAESTSEGNVTTYAYISTGALKIFNICDDKVMAVYASGKTASYSCGGISYTVKKESGDSIAVYSCDTMDVYIFHDTVSDGEVVGSYAKDVNFVYGFDKKSGVRTLNGTPIPDYSVQEKLCALVSNYYREHNGLQALTYSDKCALAGIYHSADMAEKNYFAHEDSEGRRVGSRLDDAGVDWRACAENIYAAPGRGESESIGNGIIAAHEWYVSPDHRAVMLSSAYKYIGVGIAYSSSASYIYYYTQTYSDRP